MPRMPLFRRAVLIRRARTAKPTLANQPALTRAERTAKVSPRPIRPPPHLPMAQAVWARSKVITTALTIQPAPQAVASQHTPRNRVPPPSRTGPPSKTGPAKSLGQAGSHHLPPAAIRLRAPPCLAKMHTPAPMHRPQAPAWPMHALPLHLRLLATTWARATTPDQPMGLPLVLLHPPAEVARPTRLPRLDRRLWPVRVVRAEAPRGTTQATLRQPHVHGRAAGPLGTTARPQPPLPRPVLRPGAEHLGLMTLRIPSAPIAQAQTLRNRRPVRSMSPGSRAIPAMSPATTATSRPVHVPIVLPPLGISRRAQCRIRTTGPAARGTMSLQASPAGAPPRPDGQRASALRNSSKTHTAPALRQRAIPERRPRTTIEQRRQPVTHAGRRTVLRSYRADSPTSKHQQPRDASRPAGQRSYGAWGRCGLVAGNSRGSRLMPWALQASACLPWAGMPRPGSRRWPFMVSLR